VISTEGLRLRALEMLGALGPVLAREALENGALEIEPNVLEWQGSHGRVRAHRVVLRLEPGACGEIGRSPSALDALTAAVAAAVAEESGNTLASLDLRPGSPDRSKTTPYRGRLG
jgi:hypothetical protein